MKKWRVILIVVCLILFLVAASLLIYTLYGYHVGAETYERAAEAFVVPSPSLSPSQAPTVVSDTSENSDAEASAEPAVSEQPPIQIDFASLLAQNSNVVGWVYSAGTVINYPVVRGDDNSYYLKHLMDGTYNNDGSIFMDCNNRADFSDSNTIVYGHNMKDGQMFAELLHYSDQTYYEAHPIIWLLTPTQNYKIVLFSGYTTTPTSDTYTIFQNFGDELLNYGQKRQAMSDFTTGITLTGQERLITLSTCSYSFNNARYAVHGILTPVG